MSLEEKVEYLEDKLARTLEVLMHLVRLDTGIDKRTTEWLEDQIEELQKWED